MKTYKTKDVTAGLEKLKKEEVDAFIYDSTGMNYLCDKANLADSSEFYYSATFETCYLSIYRIFLWPLHHVKADIYFST